MTKQDATNILTHLAVLTQTVSQQCIAVSEDTMTTQIDKLNALVAAANLNFKLASIQIELDHATQETE